MLADVVLTSNRRPADLYSAGLNRHVYIPALCALLQRQLVIYGLEGEGDYRELQAAQRAASHRDRYHASAGLCASAQLRSALEAEGGELGPEIFSLGGGRKLRIRHANTTGCLLSFDELCVSALGS